MIIEFDTNKCIWKEATYGVNYTTVDAYIVYWNVYDNYFMINNQKFKKEQYQNKIKIEIN